MVAPFVRASTRRRSVICLRTSGSRSAIGSSRSSSRGRLPRARAKATRVDWPPESVPTLALIGMPPSSMTDSAVSWCQVGFSSCPMRRVSRTLKRG
ncbi:hypothetical protein QFZ32_009231 [Streptomyces canus]|nr:hypothetical protein [Streptomyces canus]MDQ1073703.1 hypothetical protein [Streptomyces canus]